MKVSELPKEYKALAEKRAREDGDSHFEESSNRLTQKFHWKSTPEGGDWWNDVDNAKSKESLPPLPKGSKKIIYNRKLLIL